MNPTYFLGCYKKLGSESGGCGWVAVAPFLSERHHNRAVAHSHTPLTHTHNLLFAIQHLIVIGKCVVGKCVQRDRVCHQFLRSNNTPERCHSPQYSLAVYILSALCCACNCGQQNKTTKNIQKEGQSNTFVKAHKPKAVCG